MTEQEIITWLLDSDPSIRWQVIAGPQVVGGGLSVDNPSTLIWEVAK